MSFTLKNYENLVRFELNELNNWKLALKRFPIFASSTIVNSRHRKLMYVLYLLCEHQQLSLICCITHLKCSSEGHRTGYCNHFETNATKIHLRHACKKIGPRKNRIWVPDRIACVPGLITIGFVINTFGFTIESYLGLVCDRIPFGSSTESHLGAGTNHIWLRQRIAFEPETRSQ